MLHVLNQAIDNQETVIVRRRDGRDVAIVPASELAGARHGENVSEIQIEREHDPSLLDCFDDDIGIGKLN